MNKINTALSMCSVAFVVLLALSSVQETEQASVISHVPLVRLPRSTATQNTEICLNKTPCGWAVYQPYTRTVTTYMPNTCSCPQGKNCYRTEDDLSSSAYVYICKDKV
ncbi:uncharacterized protein LOC129747108 [Uranotaenia lowii]|uniref:uncharacterized protein LOC129747108 n=1 Tax=Uranotaenia lowii TaxID=190385 RepID=UPI0024798BB7|nr:uncharacterized protein LOC129747108 [Uranotaenia lowii]